MEIINSNKIKFYIGFDCTAKSLHVGSLIQIMIMSLFQKYGHAPIVLIGKGTTRIGDPSGKDETRKILSDNEIDSNAENLKQVFNRFLTSDPIVELKNLSFGIVCTRLRTDLFIASAFLSIPISLVTGCLLKDRLISLNALDILVIAIKRSIFIYLYLSI